LQSGRQSSHDGTLPPEAFIFSAHKDGKEPMPQAHSENISRKLLKKAAWILV